VSKAQREGKSVESFHDPQDWEERIAGADEYAHRIVKGFRLLVRISKGEKLFNQWRSLSQIFCEESSFLE
jgi:hypothetical protein